MRKAVVVTVYNNPEQLNIFTKQLLSDNTTEIFIHLDKKKQDIRPLIETNEHIHFVEDSVDVEWGGYSFLMAIIKSWRQVINYGKFDYVVLCSGQDLMVKNGLDQYLQDHPKQIFIDSFEDDKTRRAFLLHKWPHRYFKIIDTKFSLTRILRVLRIKIFKAGIPVLKRKLNYDVNSIKFYKNWFWSCIPYEVIEWIVNYLDANPDYIEVFKGFVAEEGFIATTIMLSPYKDWLKFDSNGKSHSLTYRKLSVNNHPPILNVDDIPQIEKSDCFFARKIDINTDSEIIEYFNSKYFDIIQ